MLFQLRKLSLALIAAFAILLAGKAQALGLTPLEHYAAKNPDGSTEVDIIVYFDTKLDVSELRREVNTSILAKNLSRKELRRAHKKATRRVMLKQLKTDLVKPYAILKAFLAEYGIKRKINKLWISNALALKVPYDLVSEIQDLEGVARVSIDYTFVMSESTTDITSGIPLWNLSDINATTLWEEGLAGDGVVVGILDSGVDVNHPDLSDSWRGGDNSWFDPYGVHDTPVDYVGHGTQVTGLIVGGDNSGYQIGVAPKAKWIAAKIFDDTGMSSISKISAALQWMMDPDGDSTTDDAPDIINNSWVIENLINVCSQSLGDIELDLINESLAKFREAGIAVVFAAGNFGPSLETSLPPANDPSIALSIGSLNQLQEVEFTSSRGPGACDGTIYPKLVAPGDSIFTTDKLPNSYNVVSGTSFAAPHVAGAVAQLMSAPFEASLTQIESALRETALDVDEFGEDNNSGYGLIDVAAAYNWLLNTLEITEAGILLFSSSTYSVDENTSKLVVTVRRIGGSKGEVSVDYRTADGSALGFLNMDFASTDGTLTFNDSETSRTFEIDIINDSLDETNEDFTIELSNPTGGALLGAYTTATAVILDDDGPGELLLESNSYAINENSTTLELNVLRTGGYEGEISVGYATSDGTADGFTDYRSIEGRLDFADGERSQTITIEILNDDIYETNETFDLSLSNPLGGAAISDTDSANITILNDDVDPLQTVIQFESANYAVLENSGILEVTIKRLGDTSDKVTIDYKTTDGSAIEGLDYEMVSGTATFLAGQTSQTVPIDINILDDGRYEKSETFNLVLFNATNGATLGNPTLSLVTIKDNDAAAFVSLSSTIGTTSDTSNLPDSTDINETTAEPSSDQPETTSDGSLVIHDLSLSGFSGIGSGADDNTNPEITTKTTGIDQDKDGYAEGIDCNDANPTINPGAREIENDGVDQNCDGRDLTTNAQQGESNTLKKDIKIDSGKR